MAGNHFEHCPACNNRTLYVFQLEMSDEKYCEHCSFESVVRLERPRVRSPEEQVVLSYRSHSQTKDRKSTSKTKRWTD